MPIPEKYLADFKEQGIYHIYNRTNNREKLFLSDENRDYFLRNYAERLSPFLDTYCWCLMSNHFHLLTKVKATATITANLESRDVKDLSIIEQKFMNKLLPVGELIGHAFKRFFQSYALAFNKMYKRQGNLFYRPFKRVEVERDTQFTKTIVYIHANPLKHKLIRDFTQYKWSSWKTILSDIPTWLDREEVLNWFGGRENFISVHDELSEIYRDYEFAIED